MSDLIYEKRDAIAYLIFNRPESRNAISPTVFHRRCQYLEVTFFSVRQGCGIGIRVYLGVIDDLI